MSLERRFVAWLKYWFWPQKPVPVEPDWSAINDYMSLCDAASACHWLDPDAVLAGPFQRYLELCMDGDENPRGRARVMEFARGLVISHARGLEPVAGWEGEEWDRPLSPAGEAFVARARARVADWFADRPDTEYMLEVMDGTGNHNHRAPKTRVGASPPPMVE